MPRPRGVLILLALLLPAGILNAQRADRATITGIVMDPSGNSVPGATVRIRNENTSVETPLTTNGAGLYTSPLLVLGTYSVTVEHSGFKSVSQTSIQLVGGQTYPIDLPPHRGPFPQKVETTPPPHMRDT